LLAYIVGTLRGVPSLLAGRRRKPISARLDFMMADAITAYGLNLPSARQRTLLNGRARDCHCLTKQLTI
jgi:hypothetical protein